MFTSRASLIPCIWFDSVSSHFSMGLNVPLRNVVELSLRVDCRNLKPTICKVQRRAKQHSPWSTWCSNDLRFLKLCFGNSKILWVLI